MSRKDNLLHLEYRPSGSEGILAVVNADAGEEFITGIAVTKENKPLILSILGMMATSAILVTAMAENRQSRIVFDATLLPGLLTRIAS